ncbi:MAG: YceI family protein [Alphaproteobacteria bacterium]
MSRTINLIVAALCVGVSCPASADPVRFVVNKEKSFLKFVAMQNNAPVTGKFTEFDADIVFDYDMLDKSRIVVTVATGSLETSTKETRQTVTQHEWLAVEKFPKATFHTTKISKIPSTWDYYAEGELTLKGKTAPIQMNFQIEDFEDMAIAEGSATIKRSDYAVGEGEWAKDDVVQNQVRVEFRIVADKKAIEQ